MSQYEVDDLIKVVHPSFQSFKAQYKGKIDDNTLVLKLVEDIIASDGLLSHQRGSTVKFGVRGADIMRIEVNQPQPWFSVLLQGVIEPAEHCIELNGRTSQAQPILDPSDSATNFGQWFAQVNYHQISILMQALTDIPRTPEVLHSLAASFQTEALKIARVILQAQALYSGIKLSMAAYTVAVFEGTGELRPMLIHPRIPRKGYAAEAISPGIFIHAAEVIAWPAISDPWLQRALRDYNLALGFDNEDSLIFLWRATEDILNAHVASPSIDKSPSYEPAAENLNLYRQKDRKGVWIREVALLAHRFARHGSEAVGNVTPEQIEIARKRVAELITRHALYTTGEHRFDKPHPDGLTGWLKTERIHTPPRPPAG